jgi:hypothetical protein
MERTYACEDEEAVFSGLEVVEKLGEGCKTDIFVESYSGLEIKNQKSELKIVLSDGNAM